MANSNEASATGLQGIKDLSLMASFSDMLNHLNESTSSATSGLYTGAWGQHTANIDMGGGASLSFKQVALFGGLALFGWWLIRKIGGK